MALVLLVEDDQRVRTAVGRVLADLGHQVLYARTGMEAVEQALAEPVEVVVLDLGLPDIDGTEVLRMLRAVTDVPILVATARDDQDEIVRTLDAGADDYVVKPFGSELLAARIRAVLRRAGADDPGGPSPMEVGGLRIDASARRAWLDGTELELTRLEFDLLQHLAARAGEVVSRRELLAKVWHQPLGGGDKTVDVHLSWLRRKLGESASRPRYLHTIRGVGVRLSAPDPGPTDPGLDG